MIKVPGLVAAYRFENDANDWSGNGNNGTIYGATFTDGKFGKALNSDSANDYVECGNAASLSGAGTALSIEVWIKAFTLGYYPIVNKFDTDWSSYFYGYSLSVEQGQNVRLWLGFGTTTNPFQTDSNLINPGAWYHIIVTYNGSYVRIFINGQLKSEFPETRTVVGSNRILYIAGPSAYNINRLVDEIRIYNRALSESEIRQSMLGYTPGEF